MTDSHVPISKRAHLFAAAGLLHDVGKVFEPAKVELGAEELGLERMLCPVRDSRYTHRHVLWTAYVLRKIRSDFGGMNQQDLFRLACYHHNPDPSDIGQMILQKADRLASNHDRRPTEESRKVTGLHGSMAGLFGHPGVAEADSQIPTVPLGFSEADFLPRASQDMDQYRGACSRLSTLLLEHLGHDYPDERGCVEHLLAVGQRLLGSVPSSRFWREVPDVSLYDHSLVVSAFAACLAAQQEATKEEDIDRDRLVGHYRLASFSLGGIQDFIFRDLPEADGSGPTGKGRAKRLRARSFYVTLLSNLVSRRLLEASGMPATNVVLDAGGRAMLLLPDVPAIIDSVTDAVRQIRRWFTDELAGTIRLDLALTGPLQDADFERDRFATTFRQAFDAVDVARLGNLSPELADDQGWTEANWVGTSPGLPVDTGSFSRRLRTLGERLPTSRYFVIDGASSIIDILGYKVDLATEAGAKGRAYALQLAPDVTEPILITGNYIPLATAQDVGTDPAGSEPDSEPLREGQPIPFDRLSQKAIGLNARPCTAPMLGVLKADVDRLGYLMGYGLLDDSGKADRVSLGRAAGLSRSLDLFFKGFLTDQLRSSYGNMYTVFCGGDDLLLVGPWFDAVRLAADLRKWLERFAAGHPRVSISAGVIFAKPRTPVGQLAAASDKALEEAKSHGRNQAVIAGTRMNWAQVDEALGLHAALLAAGEEGRNSLGGSLLYRLLRYSDMALRADETEAPRLEDLKWRSQLNYDLKRNLPLRTDAEQREDHPVVRVHAKLMELRAEDAGILRLAALLTLYSLRGEDS